MIPLPKGSQRHGALRGLILWALSQSPANGAELISTIEKMWWGLWRPSPGTIYPLLSSMAEEGLIARRQDGRYELTERGRRELEDSYWIPQRRTMSVDVAIEEMEGYVRYLEDLRGSLAPHRERLLELAERLRRLAGE